MQYPKQFAEVSIAESPESYEAYLYRFKNLENQKIYLGIHKGYVGDGYWHSSKNKEFAKDFANPNSKFLYEILEYGKYNYLTYMEHKMLSEVDAAKNFNYYNLSNGIPQFKAPNLEKCQRLVEQIENREFEVVDEPVMDHVEMERLQVRFEDSKSLQREIKERVDDAGGSTEKCNPVIVYVKRIIKDGKRVDARGDGNHTVFGVDSSKHGLTVPVMRISEEVHQDYSDNELRTVGNLLNRKADVVKKPIDNKDGEKYVEDLYYEDGIPVDSKTHLADLEAFGFTKARRATIIKTVSERIKREEERLSGRVFINWGAKPYSTQLADLVSAEQDSETHCYSISSASLNFVEQVANAIKNMMDIGKNHLIIKVHHPTIQAGKDWVSKWGPHHQRNLESFFMYPTNPETGERHNITIEVVPMKMYEKNTTKSVFEIVEEAV